MHGKYCNREKIRPKNFLNRLGKIREKLGNFILPFELLPCYNFSKVQYYAQFYVVEANVLANFCL